MTDREQAGLRGPVRICDIEQDYVQPDHHWVLRTSTEFSPAGNLLEQRHWNPDGSEWSLICRYDDRGRISQKEHHRSDAKQVFSYHYDALGRLERVTTRSETGAERVCESYQYDVAGRKTATVYPDPALRGKAGVSISSDLVFEISHEASSIVTIFNERDRPVRRVFYDPNGMVDRRIVMRYDTAGRLIEEGEREADGSVREDLRHVYRYDAEGRIVEKTMCLYAFGTHRKTLVYNEQGDIVEEGHQRTAGIVDHDGDRGWTTRYRYRYDDRGNWIERAAETVLPTGNPRVSPIERRRLSYY
jgi:YD repeat-containing protein